MKWERFAATLFMLLFVLSPMLMLAQEEPAPAVAEEVATETLTQPGAVDYTSAVAMLAAAVGGAGLTWTAKKFGALKKKGAPAYLTSAFFTTLSGLGVGMSQGMHWRDALVMAALGYVAQQGVYKTAKHRPAAAG